MLHAIYRKKSQLPTHRYVTSAKAQDTRRTQEDEITSTIFGPLDFMPTEDLGKIIEVLFDSESTPNCNDISIQFWPRYNQVEPDIVFLEDLDNGKRNAYIVEVKWNAPLGSKQVEQQLDAVKTIEGIHSTSHIVLSRYAIDVGTQSRNLTWMDFKDRIIDLRKSASAGRSLRKWIDLVDCFLEKCNVRHFRGFSAGKVSDMAGQGMESVIFWPGFQGWKYIKFPEKLCGSQLERKSIFWKIAQGNKGDVSWKA